MTLDRDRILAVLATVRLPGRTDDLVSSGVVRALTLDGTSVRFVMEIDPASAEAMGPVRAEAEQKIRALPGVGNVSIILTAHSESPPPDTGTTRPQAPRRPPRIPGIERIVAIASGKGGVGKSTVAANLAAALSAEGRRVGLLDADVYGPSQPRMLGVAGRPVSPDGKTILPLGNHGVTMMSIGLMTREDEPVIWRGPMLMSALQQMLNDVAWGELDVLLVDLPPGTGDVQMTLAQKAELSGAIIVSTPQDVALLDARKGIGMFRAMGTPILGLIENMSTHVCSNCGHEEHVFGHGGVAAEAARVGVPLLAEIPLHISIREASDNGAPIVVAAPESAQAKVFGRLARDLVAAGIA